MGSSTDNDAGVGGAGDINTSGRAWALYANSNNQAYADRPFNGSLTVGQQFTIDMDNGSIAGGKSVGFQLLDQTGGFVFEFRFNGGDNEYSLYDGSVKTLNDSGKVVGYTRKGLRIGFELTSTNGYTLHIQRPNTSGSPIDYFRTLSTQAGTNIAKVRMFNNSAGNSSNGGNDTDYNLYFNSISIPEPTTFSVLAGGLLLASMKRRRS